VPVAWTGGRITVAMDDPTDEAAIEALEGAARCPLDLVTGTAAAIGRAFARVYGEPLEPHAAPAAEPAGALAALRQGLAATRQLLDALDRRHAGLAAEVAELQAERAARRAEPTSCARRAAEIFGEVSEDPSRRQGPAARKRPAVSSGG
jgi:hypothetical protein